LIGVVKVLGILLAGFKGVNRHTHAVRSRARVKICSVCHSFL
jgi:hypothetical protein